MKKTLKILPLFLLPLASCRYSVSNQVNNYHYANSELYSVGECSYLPSEVEKVKINWVSGAISLSKGAEEEKLSAYENGMDSLAEEAKMHWLISDKTLFIQYCASDFNGVIDPKGKALTISVPMGIELDINLVSASCSFVTDDYSFSSLSIDSVSGETDIPSLTSNALSVSSVSGNITIKKLSCPSITLESVSGDASLSLLSNEKIKHSSTSGSLYLEYLNDLGASISLSSVSGSIVSSRGGLSNPYSYSFGNGTSKVESSTVSGCVYVK